MNEWKRGFNMSTHPFLLCMCTMGVLVSAKSRTQQPQQPQQYPSEGPCDILLSGGAPCVAAHSTVRALYSTYSGSLYQVLRSSDNQTKDVPLFSPGGVADSAVQDKFCAGANCIILRIYDQSPKMNHLHIAGAGHMAPADKGVNASREKLVVGSHPVYAAYFDSGNGYRNDNTSGVATGDEPETIYMVTSGLHYNDKCCFDYGNAETDNKDDGPAAMEAVYFGNANGGMNHGGAGKGPWIMGDLEKGLFGSNQSKSNEPPINYEFVTAMIKGNSENSWAIKGGNAQDGNLSVYWDGARPEGYTVMKKQGAIILGIGGDNSDSAIGTFYEGVMTVGCPTKEIDDAVQANIVAAGYKSL